MPAARPRLDRERVLAEAVALADTDGLDQLSMRTLAGRLGVVPMALYKHVADKDDLVGGMVDTVVASYAAPPDGLAWREAVRRRILAAREAVLAHPWLRPAIEAGAPRTLAVLDHMDAVAGEFIGGGVSVDLTHHAMHALGHRIWGFSPEAFSTGSGTGEPPSAQDVETQLAQIEERLPHVAAITRDAFARSATGCDEQDEFEFTLDLLLDGFQRLHAAGWSSRDPTA